MTSGPKFLIALDPGAKGALASFSTTYEASGTPARWTVERLKESPQERFFQVEEYAKAADLAQASRIAILEDVGGYIGVPQPGSRMFSFGRGYGQLEGFLIALGFQILRVRPTISAG